MPNGDKVVTITLNGKGLPVASPDPVEVKKDNQKIKWCSAFEFQISIDGYPGPKYSTNSSDCAYSAKTDYFTAPVGTNYKYSITANGQINDPDIVIKP